MYICPIERDSADTVIILPRQVKSPSRLLVISASLRTIRVDPELGRSCLRFVWPLVDYRNLLHPRHPNLLEIQLYWLHDLPRYYGSNRTGARQAKSGHSTISLVICRTDTTDTYHGVREQVAVRIDGTRSALLPP
jgi:hypothetical protein